MTQRQKVSHSSSAALAVDAVSARVGVGSVAGFALGALPMLAGRCVAAGRGAEVVGLTVVLLFQLLEGAALAPPVSWALILKDATTRVRSLAC